MGNHSKIDLGRLLSTSAGILLITLMLLIAAVQNLSKTYSVHSGSGTTCSCGCLEESDECGSTCCTSLSISQCECNEPHRAVVIFLMPNSLDLFFQFDQQLETVPIPSSGLQQCENTFFESLIIETPSPIPIA